MCARGNCLGQVPSKTNLNAVEGGLMRGVKAPVGNLRGFFHEDEGETGVRLHNTTHLEREKVDPDQIVEL